MNNMNTCGNCRYLSTRPNEMPYKACRYNNPSADNVFWQSKYITTNNIIRREMDGVRVKNKANHILTIKDVIFNPPATIIIWEDHTKTVVKCSENDIYDPEKGMAMAISRKALGDRGSYYNIFEKWLEPYIEKCEEFRVAHPVQSAIYETLSNMSAKTDELRKVINDMSEKMLSYADESKSENNDNDCTTCKYEDLPDDYDPCIDCDHNYNEWKPKESAD